MKRMRIAVSGGIVLMAYLVLAANSAEGGCHGGCFTGGQGTSPNRCDGGSFFQAPAFLLGTASTGSTPPTNLELVSLTLPVGLEFSDSLGSRIFSGEATAFYVASGTIEFHLDPTADSGTVRIVESLGSDPATAGEFESVNSGGSIIVDAPDHELAIDYQNAGDVEAVLIVASAIPCTVAQSTPES